jgi:hypothetical protein
MTSAHLLAAAHYVRAVAAAVQAPLLAVLAVQVLVARAQVVQTARAVLQLLTLAAVVVQQQAQAPVARVARELLT